MNEITETKKLEYNLDYDGLFILDKLAKWNRIIGILFIIMGVISLLGIFADSSNFVLVVFTILISVFIVYLGTRLTAAATNFRSSLTNSNSENFKYGLDNLRQYFVVTGISYFVGFILMIILMLIGSFFGFGTESLYDI